METLLSSYEKMLSPFVHGIRLDGCEYWATHQQGRLMVGEAEVCIISLRTLPSIVCGVSFVGVRMHWLIVLDPDVGGWRVCSGDSEYLRDCRDV